MFHWSSDSYLMCMCERLTEWPGQNHQSGVAPPEWECWEPSCHPHRRSAAAEREKGGKCWMQMCADTQKHRG